jgi:hypothetical protein
MPSSLPDVAKRSIPPRKPGNQLTRDSSIPAIRMRAKTFLLIHLAPLFAYVTVAVASYSIPPFLQQKPPLLRGAQTRDGCSRVEGRGSREMDIIPPKKIKKVLYGQFRPVSRVLLFSGF